MSRRLDESIEHLKETTAAKERIESELQIAHEIQMSMVAKDFSSVSRAQRAMLSPLWCRPRRDEGISTISSSSMTIIYVLP